MNNEGSDKKLHKEEGDAAQAMAVISVKKQQSLQVELPTSTEKPSSGDALLAREGAYAFKAGSSLPEDRVEDLKSSQIFLVRYQDELYAIRPEDLQVGLPKFTA